VTVHKFDLTSAAFKQNPFPVFAQMRKIGPVFKTRLPVLGECWVTTTYEAADKVLRDKEHFCTDALNAGKGSRLAMLGPLRWFLPRAVTAMVKNMLTMDEPDHRRLRSLAEVAFARQNVEEMRPRIEQITSQCLDRLEAAAGGSGSVDLQNEFARHAPLAVICELLGLPEDDRGRFSRWFDFGSAKGCFSMIWAMRHMGKLSRYLKGQFEECRHNPRPGMISALVQAELDGDRLNDEELLASVMLLLLAGHETTTHLITVGLLSLLQHPAAKTELMADWSNVDSAVDEMLRYNSTIQMTKPRYARQDMEFYGHQIKQGEFFMPMLAAANYDPAEFTDPQRFDINRTKNNHMAFGRGIHVCLGLKLAKAEAAIAFEQLLTRFPDISLADAGNISWSTRIGSRTLTGLAVNLNTESAPGTPAI